MICIVLLHDTKKRDKNDVAGFMNDNEQQHAATHLSFVPS
jgi:hypothetical protein